MVPPGIVARMALEAVRELSLAPWSQLRRFPRRSGYAAEADGRDNSMVVLVRWRGGGDEYRRPDSGVGQRAPCN